MQFEACGNNYRKPVAVPCQTYLPNSTTRNAGRLADSYPQPVNFNYCQPEHPIHPYSGYGFQQTYYPAMNWAKSIGQAGLCPGSVVCQCSQSLMKSPERRFSLSAYWRRGMHSSLAQSPSFWLERGFFSRWFGTCMACCFRQDQAAVDKRLASCQNRTAPTYRPTKPLLRSRMTRAIGRDGVVGGGGDGDVDVVTGNGDSAGLTSCFDGSRLDLSRLVDGGEFDEPLSVALYSAQSLESLEFELLEARCAKPSRDWRTWRFGNQCRTKRTSYTCEQAGKTNQVKCMPSDWPVQRLSTGQYCPCLSAPAFAHYPLEEGPLANGEVRFPQPVYYAQQQQQHVQQQVQQQQQHTAHWKRSRAPPLLPQPPYFSMPTMAYAPMGPRGMDVNRITLRHHS